MHINSLSPMTRQTTHILTRKSNNATTDTHSPIHKSNMTLYAAHTSIHNKINFLQSMYTYTTRPTLRHHLLLFSRHVPYYPTSINFRALYISATPFQHMYPIHYVLIGQHSLSLPCVGMFIPTPGSS